VSRHARYGETTAFRRRFGYILKVTTGTSRLPM
jgi:hypothetical protein